MRRKAGIIQIIKEIINGIKKQTVDLLFPRRCPLCDDVLPVFEISQESACVCPECKKKLKIVKEPVCKKCGKPLERERAEYCLDCVKKRHVFVQGKAVFEYCGDLQQSLYRFKYANRREYADFYAAEAAKRYEKWIKQHNIQVIVPIPLYKKKQKKRGYNQAEVFAKALGEKIGIPVCTDLLTREKNTIPQKELNETERKNNLKNAFKITKNIVQLSYILLVDDIYTTGSTIDAAATVLREAGCKYIYFICVSIGRGF